MVNTIVGRVKEQELLKSALLSKRAEFIAIYGRRRIGKTYLIRNFFSSTDSMFFQTVGTQNDSMHIQLQNFTRDLSNAFYNDESIQAAKSWREAFEKLHKAISSISVSKNIVLFFDELPWMVTPKSKFLESLEYFWNRFWSNMQNLKIIICGSSASWIIKKIINNRGGLHNRVTRQIILKPFLLHETETYLNEILNCKYNRQQILEVYMAIGGVPYYLNYIKNKLSVMQNINDICFRADGILFNEFDNLFNDAVEYIEIIRILAKTKYGLSRIELEEKCKLSKKGGSFTNKLQALEDAGFILSFLPFNKNKGLFYKVIDEYSLFYLHWIECEKKTLLKIEYNNNFWEDKYKTPSWRSWAGYAFEAICYKHLLNIRRALKIPESSTSSTWKFVAKDNTDSGAQIDLVFSRNDKAYTLCEIKYTDEPFIITKEYAKKLFNKEEIFIKQTRTKKQIFMALISASGLKDNIHSEGIISGEVTADDLFKNYI